VSAAMEYIALTVHMGVTKRKSVEQYFHPPGSDDADPFVNRLEHIRSARRFREIRW
jgi:hypothetical protein